MQGTRVSPEPELIRTEEIEKIVAGVTHDGIVYVTGYKVHLFRISSTHSFASFRAYFQPGFLRSAVFSTSPPPPPRPFDVNLVPINSAHLPSPYGSARNESPRWIRAL